MRWLGREADHSPPSSAEVTNEWSYNSTPQYAFMACKCKTDILPFFGSWSDKEYAEVQ